jgi:hypothetical protein
MKRLGDEQLHVGSRAHVDRVGGEEEAERRRTALMARQRGYRLAEERKRRELTQAPLADAMETTWRSPRARGRRWHRPWQELSFGTSRSALWRPWFPQGDQVLTAGSTARSPSGGWGPTTRAGRPARPRRRSRSRRERSTRRVDGSRAREVATGGEGRLAVTHKQPGGNDAEPEQACELSVVDQSWFHPCNSTGERMFEHRALAITRAGRLRGRPGPARGTCTRARTRSSWVVSATCPPVTCSASGRPPPSTAKWIFVLQAPRDRPSACSGRHLGRLLWFDPAPLRALAACWCARAIEESTTPATARTPAAQPATVSLATLMGPGSHHEEGTGCEVCGSQHGDDEL